MTRPTSHEHREVHEMIPAPPGWSAVFAERSSSDDGSCRWELDARPLLALARCSSWQSEYEHESLEDAREQGSRIDTTFIGISTAEFCYVGMTEWFELTEESVDEFVGYLRPDQTIDVFRPWLEHKDAPT